MWMQGGPGCSDETGNTQEFGPISFQILPNGTSIPVAMPVTWNDEYNLLFIDQPVGVGFSPAGPGDNVTAAWQAAE